jgi:hypothetical protein
MPERAPGGSAAGERSNMRGPAPDAARGSVRGPDSDRSMTRSRSDGDRNFSRSRFDRGPGVARYSRDSGPNVNVRIRAGDRGYYGPRHRYYRYGVRTYPRHFGPRCVVRKRLVRTWHGPRWVVRKVCYR